MRENHVLGLFHMIYIIGFSYGVNKRNTHQVLENEILIRCIIYNLFFYVI